MIGDGNPYTLSFDTNEERAAYVTGKLVEFNRPHQSSLWQQPPQPPAPLHIYVVDETGRVCGGVIGRTNAIPEWLEIQVIWVAEHLRGQGFGRQLMHAAETQAQHVGCRYARLITSQYQAPAFYQKLGYRLYGTLENCPRGETDYFFCKELGA